MKRVGTKDVLVAELGTLAWPFILGQTEAYHGINRTRGTDTVVYFQSKPHAFTPTARKLAFAINTTGYQCLISKCNKAYKQNVYTVTKTKI